MNKLHIIAVVLACVCATMAAAESDEYFAENANGVKVVKIYGGDLAAINSSEIIVDSTWRGRVVIRIDGRELPVYQFEREYSLNVDRLPIAIDAKPEPRELSDYELKTAIRGYYGNMGEALVYALEQGGVSWMSMDGSSMWIQESQMVDQDGFTILRFRNDGTDAATVASEAVKNIVDTWLGTSPWSSGGTKNVVYEKFVEKLNELDGTTEYGEAKWFAFQRQRLPERLNELAGYIEIVGPMILSGPAMAAGVGGNFVLAVDGAINAVAEKNPLGFALSLLPYMKLPTSKALSLMAGGRTQALVNALDIDVLRAIKNQVKALRLAKPEMEELKRVAAASGLREEVKQLACEGVFCFRSGTKVWSPSGLKSIDEFRVGDSCYSWDQLDGVISVSIITETTCNVAQGLWEIELLGGLGASTIGVTSEHPVLVSRGMNLVWVEAGQLKIGDRLVSRSDNGAVVTGMRWLSELVDVYNIRIGDDHTFFIDQNGIIVHNAGCFDRLMVKYYDGKVLDCFDDLDENAIKYIFRTNKNTGVPYNMNAKKLGVLLRLIKRNQHELIPVSTIWEGMFERITDPLEQKRVLSLIDHQRVSVNKVWFNKVQLAPDIPKGYSLDRLPLGHPGGVHPTTKQVYTWGGASAKFHELSKAKFFESIKAGKLDVGEHRDKMHKLFKDYFENVDGFNVLDDIKNAFDDNVSNWEKFIAGKGW